MNIMDYNRVMTKAKGKSMGRNVDRFLLGMCSCIWPEMLRILM